MRGSFWATIVTAICLVTITQSHAQRPTESAAADERAPANVRFRARTVEERLASVRRLDAEARRRTRGAAASPPLLLNLTLDDTFSLTPRTPFVPGQGDMAMYQMERLNPSVEPSGEVRFRDHSAASIRLHISNSGRRRLLIECTVSIGAAAKFKASLKDPPSTYIWQEDSTPYDNLISFLTPPMPEGSGPNFEFSIRRDPADNWHLLGCQVTRMAPP